MGAGSSQRTQGVSPPPAGQRLGSDAPSHRSFGHERPGITVSGCQEGAGSEVEVFIAGAGPVGLLLANLLGARGRRVLVVDKRPGPPAHSMAIGITPPSLHILARLGLDEEMIGRGVRIEKAHVHGERGYLDCVSFGALADRYPFILSLPQSVTMEVLEAGLRRYPTVTLRRGVEVTAVRQTDDLGYVELTGANRTQTEAVSAPWIAACDGGRSRLRELLHIRHTTTAYPAHFVMGDFADRTGWAGEAHLFFRADGAVESFPLPGGLRRWIVQTSIPMENAPRGFIGDVVRRRAGLDLPVEDQINQSAFSPHRLDCQRIVEGRLILCGDAAHLMSPVGGQGMNTGFADAEFLADALEEILAGRALPAPLLAAYDRMRRRAAKMAASRAARGMWLGTWTGRSAAFVRDWIIGRILFRPPLARRLAPYFAMLTIPGRGLRPGGAPPVLPDGAV
jgi:2-polyprenyl-6-methoxyphenol hydroxylase-like FAD-dependent oxidoreductase